MVSKKMKNLDSYSIDSIFFCKTGALHNHVEINWFHSVYISTHKSNIISYKTYKNNQLGDEFIYSKNTWDSLFKTQNNILNQKFIQDKVQRYIKPIKCP
jgi:hypothetical protein